MKGALVFAMLATACVDEAPGQWRYVYSSIVVPSCTTSACHSTLSRAGAVDLSDAASAYQSLTGRACDDVAAPIGGYVDPADPANSILSGLLRRSGPTGMPPNGRLADSEIERIEAWMSSGAPCE